MYGPMFMVRAVVPHMPAGGRIINISSTAARMPLAAYNVYGTSKAALDYLTAVWAGEVVPALSSLKKKKEIN